MTDRIRREAHYDGRLIRCFADRPPTIDACFRRSAERQPDRLALIGRDDRVTYRELEERVARLSAGLSALAIEPGDRLAVVMGNRSEFVVSTLAAARLGLILVPLNVRNRRPELAFMLAQCSATGLIYDGATASEIPGPDDLPALRHRIALDGRARSEDLDFSTLAATAPSADVWPEADEETPFCILYTSGTTGRPKGAVLTHLGVVHSLEHFRRAFELTERDTTVLAVPASHVTGLVALVLTSLHAGGTLCLMEGFKAREFLALVERERVTYTLMVPAMYNLCLLCSDLEGFDLSSWRVGGFGGAPMPAATVTRLRDAMGGLGLSNVYGATETTSPATLLPVQDALTHCGSVGKVLPCADILVLDAAGHEVCPGERGELLIGGPMVIPGYWDNEEANAKSFVGGYWRSGDIGSIDAEGYVAIHDRLKDVVNRGGYKIYCIEVENVIAQYPGVVECAVIGVPDAVLGERVCAFVVGSPVSKEDLRRHCAERLADYKVPERFVISAGELKRNPNGKIRKDILRAQGALVASSSK